MQIKYQWNKRNFSNYNQVIRMFQIVMQPNIKVCYITMQLFTQLTVPLLVLEVV